MSSRDDKIKIENYSLSPLYNKYLHVKPIANSQKTKETQNFSNIIFDKCAVIAGVSPNYLKVENFCKLLFFPLSACSNFFQYDNHSCDESRSVVSRPICTYLVCFSYLIDLEDHYNDDQRDDVLHFHLLHHYKSFKKKEILYNMMSMTKCFSSS